MTTPMVPASSTSMPRREWRWKMMPVIAATLLGTSGVAMPALAACNKAINVTQKTSMNFGTLAVSSTGGTVTISPAGAVTGAAFTSGGAAAGVFQVTGSKNCPLIIMFTGTNLTSTFLPAGTPMPLNNFKTNVGTTPTLSAGGQLTFNVGADLQVSGTQAGGTYTGTYMVTVTY